MKRWLFILILVPLLISAEAVSGSVGSAEQIALFGYTPVYVEELTFHIRDHVALVSVYFKKEADVDLSGNDWLKEFNGEIPVKVLERRVLDALSIAKAIQLLAIERDLAETLPFPGFAEACERINRTRVEGRKAGRILYGPVEYSPRQYYKYKLGNMRNHLRDALSSDEYKQRERLLTSALEKQKQSLSLTVDQEKLDRLMATSLRLE